MKKITILLVTVLLFTLTACDSADVPSEKTPTVDNQTEETIAETTEIEETITETTETEEQLVTYYDRDSTINLYLNRFNSLNPDLLINSDLFKVYYHHGKEHDNQIIFNREDVEVVITGNAWNSSIKIVIDSNGDKTVDDYKKLFYQYGRAFSPELTDEKLETYWQSVLNDIINNAEFDEFDCSLQVNDDKIQYMIIEGKIS